MKPVRLMKPHPAAALFPLLDDAQLRELKEDIRQHGVRQPVVTYQGMLLDGRNRIRACDLLGVNPPHVEYDGDDPIGFVISANLRRRHMDDGQRALVAAKLATMRQGARTDLSPIGEKSQAEAAHLLNVSKRSVERAGVVLDTGTPELVAAVERGEASVSAAAAVASLPPEEQRAAVAAGTVATVAREIRRSPEPTGGADQCGQVSRCQPAPDRATAPPAVQPAAQPRERRTARQLEPEVVGYDARDQELDSLRGAVDALTERNAELEDELAGLREEIALGRLPSDEALTVKSVIDELRAEVAALRKELATATAALKATTASRDTLMAEKAQMQRQLAAQRREIEKLGGGRRAWA